MKKKPPKSKEVTRSSGSRPSKQPSPRVKPHQQKRYVLVDYPREGETITGRNYSFRVSASPTESVEVSIDDQAWFPCRHSVGYWWYDWSGFAAGPHSLLARMHTEGKRRLTSKPRQFTVLE